MLVTHLGATWEPFTKRAEGMFEGIRYPSYLTRLSEIHLLPGASIDVVSKAVSAYMGQDWDRDRIDELIAPVAKWAREKKLRLLCGEFGALRVRLDPTSRNRWLSDVRQTLEQANIGWSVWDYADVFGIAGPAPGSGRQLRDGAVVPLSVAAPVRVLDSNALQSLGMVAR
jgi:hypothetical protein